MYTLSDPVALLDRLLAQQFLGDRADVLHEDAVEPGADQHDQHQDVEVGRPGERRAGLLHPAQVHHRDEHHAGETQRYRPRTAEPRRRPDGEDATRHTDGDGEDVVDEERRPCDERGGATEVLAADDVGTTARRIRMDRLSVRRHDDRHQDAHDDRDRHERLERRRSHACPEHDDDQDLVRRVCRGGDRVGGEDGEGDLLAEAVFCLVSTGDRLTENESFESSHRYRSAR
jgi:hypothetical protein